MRQPSRPFPLFAACALWLGLQACDSDESTDGGGSSTSSTGTGGSSTGTGGSSTGTGGSSTGTGGGSTGGAGGGACLAACEQCDLQNDTCCGGLVCENWFCDGNNYCVVADPDQNECPSSDPQYDDPCSEPGLKGQTDCSALSPGWECACDTDGESSWQQQCR